MIVNHLGKNPKNGGKPANEKKFAVKIKFSNLLFLKRFIWLINKILFLCIIMMIAMEINL